MRKRKNDFLNGVEKALRSEYSEDFTEKVMQKAWIRFEELVSENEKEPKAMWIHTGKRIYPAISVFEALLSMKVEREKAVAVLADFYRKRSEKKGRQIRMIMKIPGLYKRVPKFFAKMTPKFFGESAGFRAEFLEQTKTAVKFDMLVCPYQDICQKYDCPEIVAMFCEADDACYGNMHPKVQWLRTKTLGKGGDCCDFEVRVAGIRKRA